jgi:hypothetical protein
MKTVCVFAGSGTGVRPAYSEAARALGRQLVSRRVGLVYGGGGSGLMGVLADTVLAGGGSVTGIIPGALATREVAHASLTRLQVVHTMHERKAEMAGQSDGFIALPGGLGTLEELMEIWTWAQLGIHAKPCGLLNAAGYYDRLLALVDQMVEEEFVRPAHRELIVVDEDAARLLDRLEQFRPSPIRRWMDASET